jgi:hypothetical protein
LWVVNRGEGDRNRKVMGIDVGIMMRMSTIGDNESFISVFSQILNPKKGKKGFFVFRRKNKKKKREITLFPVKSPLLTPHV